MTNRKNKRKQITHIKITCTTGHEKNYFPRFPSDIFHLCFPSLKKYKLQEMKSLNVGYLSNPPECLIVIDVIV